MRGCKIRVGRPFKPDTRSPSPSLAKDAAQKAREKASTERKQSREEKKQTDGETHTQCGAKDRDWSIGASGAVSHALRHAPGLNSMSPFASPSCLLRIGGEAKRAAYAHRRTDAHAHAHTHAHTRTRTHTRARTPASRPPMTCTAGWGRGKSVPRGRLSRPPYRSRFGEASPGLPVTGQTTIQAAKPALQVKRKPNDGSKFCGHYRQRVRASYGH